MMRRDILLVVAAVLMVAAGVLVAVPLGLAVAGLCAGGAWFLLGDA